MEVLKQKIIDDVIENSILENTKIDNPFKMPIIRDYVDFEYILIKFSCIASGNFNWALYKQELKTISDKKIDIITVKRKMFEEDELHIKKYYFDISDCFYRH